MLQPVKLGYLKHDLYKITFEDRDALSKGYQLENIPPIKPFRIAKKGCKFIYCNTNYKDGAMGWYFYGDGSGTIRRGHGGFEIMSTQWGEENLENFEEIKGRPFKDYW